MLGLLYRLADAFEQLDGMARPALRHRQLAWTPIAGAHRQFIPLLYAAGRAGGGAGPLQACPAAAGRRLGVEPDPATVA